MRRLSGLEKTGLQFEMSKQESGTPNSAAVAFRTLCDNPRSADLLNRYETRYHRQHSRTLNLLLTKRNFQTNLVPQTDTTASPLYL